jgi:F-type H+-transporting ATPase subunit epsilon
MASMTCDIVTPAKKLYTQECYMVVVPGELGAMGFMPGHAPLVSTLADGTVRVYSDASTVSQTYALQGGYVQVTGEKVIILADKAVPVGEIDVDDVKAQIANLESQIAQLSEDSAERSLLDIDLAWCRLQEKAAQ